jgi:hypothetical protein
MSAARAVPAATSIAAATMAAKTTAAKTMAAKTLIHPSATGAANLRRRKCRVKVAE